MIGEENPEKVIASIYSAVSLKVGQDYPRVTSTPKLAAPPKTNAATYA